MNQKTPNQKLSENEELWLKEIYQLFIKNHFRPDIKTLKRKLMSKLNSHFNPKNINPFLLRNGNEITPIGIRYIDPDSDYFQKIDFIIKSIKKILSENDIKEIRIKDLSKITNLTISKISQLLYLISTFDGCSFWAGYGYEKNGDFIYINVDREDVIDEYIAYDNIQDFLKRDKIFVRIIKSELQKVANKNKPPQTFNYSTHFVDIERILELKNVNSEKFDISKLIRLCDELNLANENESYFSVIFLLRSILDHIPPIFGKKSFVEVVNSSKKSSKEILDKLENSSRKIADSHIHSQISEKETLPNPNQTNFAAELDFLLCEVIKQLNK